MVEGLLGGGGGDVSIDNRTDLQVLGRGTVTAQSSRDEAVVTLPVFG